MQATVSATSAAAHTAHVAALIVISKATLTAVQVAQTNVTAAINSALASAQQVIATPAPRRPEAKQIPATCNKAFQAATSASRIAENQAPTVVSAQQAIKSCNQAVTATANAVQVAQAIAQTPAEEVAYRIAEAHYSTAARCLTDAESAPTPAATMVLVQAAAAHIAAAVAQVATVGTMSA